MYRLLEEDGRLNDHAPFQINFLIECFAGSLPSDDHAETFLEISGPGVEELSLEPVALWTREDNRGPRFWRHFIDIPTYRNYSLLSLLPRFRHEL